MFNSSYRNAYWWFLYPKSHKGPLFPTILSNSAKRKHSCVIIDGNLISTPALFKNMSSS